MKKGIFSFAIGAGLLLAYPFMVHGDELEGKAEENRSGLISGTVKTLGNTVGNVGGQAGKSTGAILEETAKSVEKTVKDAVDFTAGTIEKISDPVENKVITSTVKDTGSLVEKAVANTTPAVKTTVKETTGTVTKTTSEVFDAVDETVENLPEVPVVTPVVKEVNKTLQKVTSGVQQTVEKTADKVNETVEAVTDTAEKTVEKTIDAVDKAADLPHEAEKPTPVQQPEIPASEQPAAEEVTRPEVPVTQPQAPAGYEDPVQNELPLENEVPVVSRQPDENTIALKVEEDTGETPLQEAPSALIEETVEVPATQPSAAGTMEIGGTPVASVIQLPIAENEMDRSEAAKETAPATQTPIFPEEQDGNRALATVPVQPGSPSSAQASGSFNGHSTDLSYGNIASSDMFKLSAQKLWYHRNSYAIIQWIHTPLRKPPAITPFLNVA
ncbi:hypothetical protein [Planococcus sp. CAU13]|uniref:hypothetical protein n=1 Tax=Planococcus sp. CAU13 TaxID=1541197 RepID=UPI00052FDE68|nr:hypothetical protein [Planococcus sp. CAU13]